MTALLNATPTVSGRYGAPMGRRSSTMPNIDPAKPLQLFRVPLNSGGYDRGGAYWGHGAPLYCVMDWSGDTAFFRARDRAAAKAHVMAEHDSPELVRFYR